MAETILEVLKAGKYKLIEDVPVPPVVPFRIVDNAVNGAAPYQCAYTGNWVYGTNIPGWNDGTLSYSNDGQVSMKFNGSGVEVYTETGPTHGIVGLQVNGGPEALIDLYSPEFKQQVKVWSFTVGGTSVIKMRSTGTKNPLSSGTYAILDYFKVLNPAEVPDVPVPPVGDVTVVQPGQSIKAIVESAPAGKTIQLLTGEYNENIVNVPIGVHIKAAGSGKTIINFIGTHPQQSETAIFQLKSSTQVDGKQTISGFTIRGKAGKDTDGNVIGANGGLITNNRNNVTLTDVKVENCNYFGVWPKNLGGAEWSYIDLYNTSWASPGWCTGEFCMGSLTDVSIHHVKIKTDNTTKGYGFKALWPESVFTNLKLYECDLDMHPTSLWNNGGAPNISIEFAAAHYAGIEIYKNKIRNVISMAAHRPTKSGRLWIHDNDMVEMKSNTTCAIELVCSNVTIERNGIKGAAMFTANMQPNGKWVDQVITNNDFISNGANPGWGGTFLIGADGANMNVNNNRLQVGNFARFKHMGNPANSVIVDSGNSWI